MQFEVIKANIVDVVADAVVLPANEALKEAGGASGAIFSAAGREKLASACSELGHCSIGSAVATRAFNLKAKYIIHAVVPRWVDGEHNECALLSSAYLSSLHTAKYLGCESVAFPLLASGSSGFDKQLAVRIAEESISSFEGVNLKKVFLVVYGDAMEVFMKGLGYSVITIPEHIHADKHNPTHRSTQKKATRSFKKAALHTSRYLLHETNEWIKKPENQKMIQKTAVLIAKKLII